MPARAERPTGWPHRLLLIELTAEGQERSVSILDHICADRSGHVSASPVCDTESPFGRGRRSFWVGRHSAQIGGYRMLNLTSDHDAALPFAQEGERPPCRFLIQMS